MRHSYGRTVVLKKNYVDFNGFWRFIQIYSISDNHLFSSYFLLILAIFDSHKLPVNAYPEYQTKSHLVPLQLSVVWTHQRSAPWGAIQRPPSCDQSGLCRSAHITFRWLLFQTYQPLCNICAWNKWSQRLSCPIAAHHRHAWTQLWRAMACLGAPHVL